MTFQEMPDWKSLIPADFSDFSRVWIYQSNRPLGFTEALQIEGMLEDFVANWKSHGAPVKGFANLFFGQFLIIIADESQTQVGGCSTDSSVRLVKELETLFNIQLLDRLTLAFWKNNKVELLPLQQVNYAIENGFINADTLYFNNLVQTKADLMNKWLVPVKASWLSGRLKPFVA